MPRTIPPIRPPAPDSWPSLLTVAQEGGLADAYTADPTAGWQLGVQSLDFEDINEFGWPPDATWPGGIEPADESAAAYITEKPGPVFPVLIRFHPFTFGIVIGCPSPHQVGPDATYGEWAANVLAARTARVVSEELWTGHLSQGHSLRRDAIDLTSAGAVSLEYGLGLIQEAVSDFGTWHIPAVAEATMRGKGLVVDNGLVPRGPGGWPISFGPGYPRTGPITAPWREDTREPHFEANAAHSSSAPSGDQTWIVGHAGRIEVAVRDVPADLYGGVDYRHAQTNEVEAMRERRAIFRYATTRTYAALVDLSA